jgi:plasmid stabilization system protein ParE
MNAEFHPYARAELNDGAQFYDAAAAGLGADFLNELERVVRLLTQHPEIGRGQGAGVRTFPARRFPYSVVYEVRADSVVILAVAHHRRAPRYWTDRRG